MIRFMEMRALSLRTRQKAPLSNYGKERKDEAHRVDWPH
jgi:hypothetical protein